VSAFDVVAIALSVLWAPHLVGFYRSWRDRRNPISLAIMFMILLILYTNAFAVLHLRWRVSASAAGWVYGACSAAVAIYFHLAKAWASKRFQDSRRP
jgi:hypothetical protein